MTPIGEVGERYATEMGALWFGFARTLNALEELAADPDLLEEAGVLDSLRRLQYRLHRASEDALTLSPPSGVEAVHLDLATALAGARDATGDLVTAIEEDGIEAAQRLVHEWRGALFAVRLARLRLSPAKAPPMHTQGRPLLLLAPLLAIVLVLVGTTAFVGGAVSGAWPLWAAGLLAVCGSFMAYKP